MTISPEYTYRWLFTKNKSKTRTIFFAFFSLAEEKIKMEHEASLALEAELKAEAERVERAEMESRFAAESNARILLESRLQVRIIQYQFLLYL